MFSTFPLNQPRILQCLELGFIEKLQLQHILSDDVIKNKYDVIKNKYNHELAGNFECSIPIYRVTELKPGKHASINNHFMGLFTRWVEGLGELFFQI